MNDTKLRKFVNDFSTFARTLRRDVICGRIPASQMDLSMFTSNKEAFDLFKILIEKGNYKISENGELQLSSNPNTSFQGLNQYWYCWEVAHDKIDYLNRCLEY